MTIKLDYRQLSSEAKYWRTVGRVALKVLWDELRAESFELERDLKGGTRGHQIPVLTGRARASWGHWTPGDIKPGAKGASSMDAYWKENKTKLEITQGSNVEYMEALNAGHSQQQPAGFLDEAEKDAERSLERRVDRVLNLYF